MLPEQDAVIAITSGVKDMQGVMNLVWDKLLPAFGPKRIKTDAVNQKKLTAKLASLSIRPAEGAGSSPLAAKFLGRKFVFPANEQKLEAITLTPNKSGQGVTVAIQSNGRTHQFSTGYREWEKGSGSFGSYENQPAAATGAWPANDTLVVKQCFVETPFYLTHKLRFDGQQLIYDAETNVGFRGTKQPQLVGSAE